MDPRSVIYGTVAVLAKLVRSALPDGTDYVLVISRPDGYCAWEGSLPTAAFAALCRRAALCVEGTPPAPRQSALPN